MLPGGTNAAVEDCVRKDRNPEISPELNSEVVALEIVFKILPVNRVEFLQAVESLISATAKMPGLSTLSCFEEVGQENSFLWRESWNSQAELDDRLQTGAIKTLMGAIGVLGELERMEILGVSGRSSSSVVWT